MESQVFSMKHKDTTGGSPVQHGTLNPFPSSKLTIGTHAILVVNRRCHLQRSRHAMHDVNPVKRSKLIFRFQVGDDNDYMPANQTHSEGNDDQAFWGLAAMAAAEMNFPNPPAKKPQWLALAQAVFNEQVARWDTQNCGGGLRWQIFPFNNGYDYKNSISNGCLFHLGARLARYTGNSTYMTYAERSFDWMSSAGLLDTDWAVYDGTSLPNCTTFNHIEWTYNNGQLLSGAAYLYNFVPSPLKQTKLTQTNGDATWKSRLDSLLAAAKTKFFSNGVIWEPACEQNYNCDTDQLCFKGFLAQYLALVARMAPYTAADIVPLLESSATAAASHCNTGTNNTMCSMFWTTDSGPQTTGVGQQMSALNVFNANMLKFTEVSVVTSSTGGNSTGNVNAGNPTSDQMNTITPPTTGDRVLAGVLTSLVSVGGFGFACWLAI